MSFSKIISPLGKLNRKNVIMFLALLGPGIITANVDNDAGGITTYSLAGAQFCMSLLWMMLPTTIALVVVQYKLAAVPVLEEDSRMAGIVSADDIMEHFLPFALRWKQYKATRNF